MTVLATLNTLKRLIVGHSFPFGTSFALMTVCMLLVFWGYTTFITHPIDGILSSWRAWAAALALGIGKVIFELVAYYELLYMRASVERKDSEYMERYFWNKSAFWVYVPLIVTCSELFAFVLTAPLAIAVPQLFGSSAVYLALRCFFLLWAIDFYRTSSWLARSFKSAFRLVVIFAPLLFVVGSVEWAIRWGATFLLGALDPFTEPTSLPVFIVLGIFVSMLVTLQFFVFASLANTLYLRGKHTYSEDFFTK